MLSATQEPNVFKRDKFNRDIVRSYYDQQRPEYKIRQKFIDELDNAIMNYDIDKVRSVFSSAQKEGCNIHIGNHPAWFDMAVQQEDSTSIIEWLWNQAKLSGKPFDLHWGNEVNFRWACNQNRIHMMDWFWNTSLRDTSEPINVRANNDHEFLDAQRTERHDVVAWLASKCPYYQDKVNAYNYVIVD